MFKIPFVSADWASVATISTLKTTVGYPFVTLKSMSDGPSDNGTGIPYLYMTDLDLSGKDILVSIFKRKGQFF